MTKIRFNRTTAVAACALFAFALPASATNMSNSATRPAPEATQRSENPDQAETANERRICVRMQQGGSRITRPVCKTAEEWETSGGLPGSER
jgi:hypothetical protein